MDIFSSLQRKVCTRSTSTSHFPLYFSIFFLSPTAHAHTPHTHTHSSPLLSSSVEVSGLCRHSAIWAEADKSSCAGPAMPAGRPGASEAWLSEAMGEICDGHGMPLSVLSPPAPPPLSLCQSFSQSVSQGLPWLRTGLNPHRDGKSVFLKWKPTGAGVTLGRVAPVIFAICQIDFSYSSFLSIFLFIFLLSLSEQRKLPHCLLEICATSVWSPSFIHYPWLFCLALFVTSFSFENFAMP